MDTASSASTRGAKSKITRHSASNASVMEVDANSEHSGNNASQRQPSRLRATASAIAVQAMIQKLKARAPAASTVAQTMPQ